MRYLLIVCLAACGTPSSDVCSAPATCAQGRSYRACGDGAQCRIKASDGTTFHCASCGDCAGATSQAATWCGSGGSGGGSDGGVSGGSSPDPSCATLLTCLANNLPQAFPAALQSYGTGGACWQNATTAQACHDACQTSISDYERSGQCCLSDGDCRSNLPHCDLGKHTCVACPFECCAPSDCQGRGSCESGSCQCASSSECTENGLSYCDPSAHKCEACPSGCCGPNDCTDPTRPYCEAGQCVGCLSNNDCGFAFLSQEVCDPSTHQCVGCLSDSDCSNQLFSFGKNRCDAGTCVECSADSQCATGHCQMNSCVCLADGDCGGGGRACHGGQCDQCADDTQCTTSDPHCGVDAGGIKSCAQCFNDTQCSGGNHCLDQICTTKECFTSSDCGTLFICNSSGQCYMP